MQQGSYCQLVKVSPQGELVKRFFAFDTSRGFSGGPPFFRDRDGNFIISHGESVKGWISPRGIVVVKLTEDFDTLWHYRHADTTQFDTPYDIYSDNKGHLYITGMRNLYRNQDGNDFDGFLLILDNNGRFVDFKTYDEGKRDQIYSFVPCADGGYFLGGGTNSLNIDYEGFLLKVDSMGNKLWHKNYPFISDTYFAHFSKEKIIISGYKFYSPPAKTVLGLIDTSGTVLWTKAYAFEGQPNVYRSVRTRKGDIVAVGLAGPGDNSGFILSVDSTGELNWSRRYNYNESTDFFINIIETSDGGFLVNGSATDPTEEGGQNLWLIKLDSLGCLTPRCRVVGLEDVQENELGIKLFPNPANDWLNLKLPESPGEITLEVFSVSGRRMMNLKLYAPWESIQVSHLPAGLYLVKFTDGEGRSSTQRLIVAR